MGYMAHIDIGVSDNCINHWSYGEICVGCGCCERNPNIRDRYIKQLHFYKECLEEEYKFNDWSDIWREEQEKNVKANIRYFKRKIRLIKKIIKTLKRSVENGKSN